MRCMKGRSCSAPHNTQEIINNHLLYFYLEGIWNEEEEDDDEDVVEGRTHEETLFFCSKRKRRTFLRTGKTDNNKRVRETTGVWWCVCVATKSLTPTPPNHLVELLFGSLGSPVFLKTAITVHGARGSVFPYNFCFVKENQERKKILWKRACFFICFVVIVKKFIENFEKKLIGKR